MTFAASSAEVVLAFLSRALRAKLHLIGRGEQIEVRYGGASLASVQRP